MITCDRFSLAATSRKGTGTMPRSLSQRVGSSFDGRENMPFAKEGQERFRTGEKKRSLAVAPWSGKHLLTDAWKMSQIRFTRLCLVSRRRGQQFNSYRRSLVVIQVVSASGLVSLVKEMEWLNMPIEITSTPSARRVSEGDSSAIWAYRGSGARFLQCGRAGWVGYCFGRVTNRSILFTIRERRIGSRLWSIRTRAEPGNELSANGDTYQSVDR